MSRTVLLSVAGLIGANLYYLYRQRHNNEKPDDGEYIEWHDNCFKKIQCTYKDKKLVGPYQAWHNNGNKMIECTYDENGLLDGPYARYFTDGIQNTECTYNKGNLIGRYRDFHYNGEAYEDSTYNSAGQLDGIFTGYYVHGGVHVACAYVCGKKHGLYQTWYENGKLALECTYDQDKLEGSYTQYYWNGHKEFECNYIGNAKNGLYTTWYKSGVKHGQYTYKNEVLDGPYEEYHENGTIHTQGYLCSGGERYITSKWNLNGDLELECTYDKNNILIKQIEVNNNGHRLEYIYENGVQVKVTKFYKEKKIYECDMDGCRRNGHCVEYLGKDDNYAHENRIECDYANGCLHGLYIEYDVKGAVCKKFVYENDYVKEVLSYRDEEGNECVLEDGEITVWKACHAEDDRTAVYVELLVPSAAKRVTTTKNYKARVDHTIVVSIKDKHGNKYDTAYSFVRYHKGLKYIVGQTVYPDAYCDNPAIDCASGISCHRHIKHCDQWFGSR